MRSSGWFGAAVVVLGAVGGVALAGCGGDVEGDPGGAGGVGGAGGAGPTSSSSGGPGGNSGDCDTDADCGGAACIEVTPGGYRVCQADVPEATACTQPGFDECCTTSECAAGKCLQQPLVPYCGGPAPLENNVCAQDYCATDADCTASGEAICVPAGTLGRKIRACVPVSCHVDADCAAEPGGLCAPVAEPCCNGAVGLFCVYPSDGCRSSADCGADQQCEITAAGRTRCVGGPPVCPA